MKSAATAVALTEYGFTKTDDLRASTHAEPEGGREFIPMPDLALPAPVRVQALASGALGPLALIPSAPRQLVAAVSRKQSSGTCINRFCPPRTWIGW